MKDKNFEKYERIEAYLKGQLSDKDVESFETEMNADPDLAKEVELHEEIFKSIQNNEARAFKHTLEEIKSKRKVNNFEQRKPIPLRRLFALAAAVLFLIISGYWLWNTGSFSSYSPDELYADYFSPPEAFMSNSRTVSNEEIDSARNEAILYFGAVDSLYQENQMESSLKMLNEIPVGIYNDYASEINFQKGIISLRLGYYQQAIDYLDKTEAIHTEGKNWYKALALLKIQGKTLEAKTIFQNIITSPGAKETKGKAKEILRKLN